MAPSPEVQNRPRALARRCGVVVAAVALAVVASPHGLAAQACLGSALLRGEFPVGATASFSDSMREFRAETGGNLEGPLAFRSSIGIVERDGSDERGFVGQGTGLWESGVGAFSVCPVAGFRHATWSTAPEEALAGLDFSEFSVPLGIGVGTHLGEGGAIRVAPAVGAGLIVTRFSSIPTDGSDGGTGDPFGERTRDTEAALYLSAGAGVSAGRALFRADWSYSTRDRFDPVLSLHLAVRLWSQESTRRVRD